MDEENGIHIRKENVKSFPTCDTPQDVTVMTLMRSSRLSSFYGLVPFKNLKRLIVDDSSFTSFSHAPELPNLVEFSCIGSPLGNYKHIHYMAHMVFGNSLRQVNRTNVDSLTRLQSEEHRALHKKYLIEGQIFLGLNPLKLFNPESRKRKTLFVDITALPEDKVPERFKPKPVEKPNETLLEKQKKLTDKRKQKKKPEEKTKKEEEKIINLDEEELNMKKPDSERIEFAQMSIDLLLRTVDERYAERAKKEKPVPVKKIKKKGPQKTAEPEVQENPYQDDVRIEVNQIPPMIPKKQAALTTTKKTTIEEPSKEAELDPAAEERRKEHRKSFNMMAMVENGNATAPSRRSAKSRTTATETLDQIEELKGEHKPVEPIDIKDSIDLIEQNHEVDIKDNDDEKVPMRPPISMRPSESDNEPVTPPSSTNNSEDETKLINHDDKINAEYSSEQIQQIPGPPIQQKPGVEVDDYDYYDYSEQPAKHMKDDNKQTSEVNLVNDETSEAIEQQKPILNSSVEEPQQPKEIPQLSEDYYSDDKEKPVQQPKKPVDDYYSDEEAPPPSKPPVNDYYSDEEAPPPAKPPANDYYSDDEPPPPAKPPANDYYSDDEPPPAKPPANDYYSDEE